MKITKKQLKQIIKEELQKVLSDQDPAALKHAATAIKSLPDLIKLVCAPPVEIDTGRLGKLFGMGKIKLPQPKDILKAGIVKVINSENPVAEMNTLITTFAKVPGLMPAGLNPVKIQKMVFNYKPNVIIPIPIPGLPQNPTIKDLLTTGFNELKKMPAVPKLPDGLGAMAGLAGGMFGVKVPELKGRPIDIARKFAIGNLDLFVEESCKLAKKAMPKIKKAASMLDNIDMKKY